MNENAAQPSELDLLKERADMMGITYHPNIGVEKLKAKIAEKQGTQDEETSSEPDGIEDEIESINAAADTANFRPAARQAMTPQQRKMERRNKALRLVRIRVANMDPLKSNLKGVILSVGNSELGMIKKFIPFNAEQGWHVPQILLDELRRRRFMTHYVTKIGNKKITKNRLVPEYSIEVMTPLTTKELEALKQRQIIASSGQE